MAKFTNIGYVAKGSKAKPNKPYIKVTADVSLKKDSFVSLMAPSKGAKQTDEQFAEVLEWKKFDLVVVSDE